MRRLRAQLYSRLLRAEPTSLLAFPGGELASRLTNDVVSLRAFVGTELVDLARDTLSLVGLLTLAFRIDLGTTLIAASAAPLIAGWILLVTRRAKRAHREHSQAEADLTSDTAEVSKTILAIQAVGAEPWAEERLEATVARREQSAVEGNRAVSSGGPVVQVLGAAALVLALAFAGRKVAGGELASSELVSLFAALFFAYRPAQGLAQVFAGLGLAQASRERLDELWALPQRSERPSPSGRPAQAQRAEQAEPTVAIDARGITFEYGAHRVLDGLDLQVRSGERVALVGASGEGKTTLLMLLLGLLPPKEGSIVITKGTVAWSPQDPILFRDTIAQNLLLGREREEAALRAALEGAGAGFVEALPEGVEARLLEGGANLSAGQRKKLSVARALYGGTEILLLDEPSASLDAASEEDLVRGIAALGSALTLVVASHRWSVVRRMDRVVVLRGGRIVEDGPPLELWEARGALRALLDVHHEEADA